MKKCRKCEIEKPLTDFSPSGKYYRSYCKPCEAARQRNNPASKIAHKKYVTKIQGVYGIFSNDKCLYVGESSVLLHRLAIHKMGIKNPSSRKKHKELYIRMSGYDNIQIKILEETPNHKERESYWINKLTPIYNS